MDREYVRRSVLVVSPLDADALRDAPALRPDCVLLDLASVPYLSRGEARAVVQDSVPRLRRAGIDVFVRLGAESVPADVDASVRPGVNGVMATHPEGRGHVAEAAGLVEEAERRHGVQPGSVELGVLIGTPGGLWNIRDILTASPRVTTAALDERHLALSMGLAPTPESDPFQHYGRGRFITECASLDRERYGPQGVHRLGMAFPLSMLPDPGTPRDEVYRLGRWARQSGMNGALCHFPAWVEPCNRAFTPTDQEMAAHRKVREAYAAGVASGRGAVPIGGGRFVERPQDELAKAIMDLRQRCDEKDDSPLGRRRQSVPSAGAQDRRRQAQ